MPTSHESGVQGLSHHSNAVLEHTHAHIHMREHTHTAAEEYPAYLIKE